MLETASWVSPLLLLPGVGLLLVSTSARFEAIHENIHQLLDEQTAEAKQCAAHAVRRARLLSIAMCSLYFAAAALAASGLCGTIAVWWPTAAHRTPPCISDPWRGISCGRRIDAGPRVHAHFQNHHETRARDRAAEMNRFSVSP